jgi:tetratricopeptide (TPR) repeat protein
LYPQNNARGNILESIVRDGTKNHTMKKRAVFFLPAVILFFCAAALAAQIPDDALTYYERGKLFAENGDYGRALDCYDQALKIFPRYAQAYTASAEAHTRTGDYERALLECSYALRINPDHAPAYIARGEALRQKGEWESAVGDFGQALLLRGSGRSPRFRRHPWRLILPLVGARRYPAEGVADKQAEGGAAGLALTFRPERSLGSEGETSPKFHAILPHHV